VDRSISFLKEFSPSMPINCISSLVLNLDYFSVYINDPLITQTSYFLVFLSASELGLHPVLPTYCHILPRPSLHCLSSSNRPSGFLLGLFSGPLLQQVLNPTHLQSVLFFILFPKGHIPFLIQFRSRDQQ
jgi:hypothetical protein